MMQSLEQAKAEHTMMHSHQLVTAAYVKRNAKHHAMAGMTRIDSLYIACGT